MKRNNGNFQKGLYVLFVFRTCTWQPDSNNTRKEFSQRSTQKEDRLVKFQGLHLCRRTSGAPPI